MGSFACVLAAVDYTGKSCPCPDGWRCASNVCVAGTASGSGGSGGSGGSCTPLTVPTNFRADWATPSTLRWRWDAPGPLPHFGAYRLVVGTSQASVESESGATVFTPVENPELGQLSLLHGGQSDPVTATISDGLQPATAYFAKLVLVDDAGCEHATGVVSATTTAAPSGQIAIFVDAIPFNGSTRPQSVVVDPSCAAGVPCLLYTNDCGGQPVCYENIRLELTLKGSDIQAQMTADDFANRAYLELGVAIDAMVPSYWSGFRLETDDYYGIDGQTIRAGGTFRTYQIPLRALAAAGALTYADLTTAGVHELGVGGFWADMSRVEIAAAYLKW
jgi:hypothetical protein